MRRALGDSLVDVGKGIVGVGEAAVGLADIPTFGLAGKAGEAVGWRPKAAKDMLGELYSPERKLANERVEAAEGFIGTAKEMIANPSTIVGAAVESAPLMLGGGAIARTVGKAFPGLSRPILAGIGEGTVGAGAAAEQIRQQTEDGTLSGTQVLAALGAGAGTGLLGALGGKIADKLGIADPDVLVAGGTAAATAQPKGVFRRAIEGALAEGVLEEAPQSAQEQVFQNIALERPLGEGVPEATAAGTLAGGLMGGGFSAFTRPQRRAPEEQPAPEAATATTPPAEAAPPRGTITTADVTARAQAALDALNAKAAGTPDQQVADAEGVMRTVPGTPAQILTDKEKANRDWLTANVANPQALAQRLGLDLADPAPAVPNPNAKPGTLADAANAIAAATASTPAPAPAPEAAAPTNALPAPPWLDTTTGEFTQPAVAQVTATLLQHLNARIAAGESPRIDSAQVAAAWGLSPQMVKKAHRDALQVLDAVAREKAANTANTANTANEPQLSGNSGQFDLQPAGTLQALPADDTPEPARPAVAPAPAQEPPAEIRTKSGGFFKNIDAANRAAANNPGYDVRKVARNEWVLRRAEAVDAELVGEPTAPPAQVRAITQENDNARTRDEEGRPEEVRTGQEGQGQGQALLGLPAPDAKPSAAPAAPAVPLAQFRAAERVGDQFPGATKMVGSSPDTAPNPPGNTAQAPRITATDSPEILDTDITAPSGGPFTIRKAAEIAAKREGGTVVPVDGGFVVRPGATPSQSVAQVKNPTDSFTKGASDRKDGLSSPATEPAAPAAVPVAGRTDAVGNVPPAEVAAPNGQPAAVRAEQGQAPDEPLITMKTVYGDTVRVKQSDLDSPRKMLPTYTKDGKRKETAQGFTNVHRENLDPDGSKIAKRNADLGKPPYIGRTGKGVKSAKDEGFLTPESAMKAVTKAGFKTEDYEPKRTEYGGFVAVLRESASVPAPEAAPVDTAEMKALPNATAPEHVAQADAEGISVDELKKMAKLFREAIDGGADAEVTHVFDAPTKSEIVRLQDKVRVHHAKHGWMTPKEAAAKIAEWRANAVAQGDGSNPQVRSDNSQKVVLSFFDLSGEWSKPWVEAGYQVYRFDIQDDPIAGDVNNFSSEFFTDWFGDFDGQEVYAILAACPCTDFAVSGARHFAAKDADGRTVASIKLVKQTMAAIEYFKPPVWALENPVGRIEDLTGLPPWRLSFDPNHLGDTYTKKTLIWGRFNADLPIAPVEPTEGSKMHKLYGGKSMATKNARSVTPEGFAYGFFAANNAADNQLMAIANKYDRLDRSAIAAALDAGLTGTEIADVVDDHYYMDMDDDAANAALREAASEAASNKSPVDTAAAQAATSPENDRPQPTDAQKEVGNYKVGHVVVSGLDISIENEAGTKRRPEWPTLQGHYGYFKGTIGKDKDHVDVFIKPGTPEDWGGTVFVVDQVNKDGKFDEHKVMLGYDAIDEAKAAYLANYTKGWTGLKAISATPLAEFKAWLYDQDQTRKPFHSRPEPRPAAAVTKTDKAEIRPYRRPDGSVGYEAIPISESAKRKQPGDPDYTILDARNDLIEIRTMIQGFGAVGNDRLLERERRQVKLIAEMEAAPAEGAGSDITEAINAEKQRLFRARRELGDIGNLGQFDNAEQAARRKALQDKVAGIENNLRKLRAKALDDDALAQEQPPKQAYNDPAPEVATNASTPRAEPVSGERPQGDQPNAAVGDANREPLDAGVAEDSQGAVDGEPVSSGTAAAGARGTKRPGKAAGNDALGATRDSERVGPEPGAAVAVTDDFDLADEDIGSGGLAKKYRDNIAAIKIIKALEAEGRKSTADERKQLSRYVGWGALKGVFDPNNKQWGGKQHDELKALLTPAEYAAARASQRNAHFTSKPVVAGMIRALQRMGFTRGRLLEPSVGVGNFFGMLPANLRKSAQLYGVELDPITSKIAAGLYPNAKIVNMGFQDYRVPGGFFDAAIGNPPFGDEPIVDMERSPYSGQSIHNYFFAKTIDKLRDGGLMTMVVSRYFMDRKTTSAREWIADRANLISAVRLPRTAFLGNAGTEVVTDVLVFQKRGPDMPEGSRAWVNASPVEFENGKTGAREEVTVNDWYAANPNLVLGKPSLTGSMRRANEYTVEPTGDLDTQMTEWADSLPANIHQPIDRTEVATQSEVPEGLKVGNYFTTPDGKISMRLEDVAGEMQSIAWVAPNAKAADRMIGMIKLRDLLRNQMRMERSSDAPESEIEGNRKALNKAYDAFLKEHGHLNAPVNRRLFVEDPDSPLVQSLEFDYDGGVSKAVADREGIDQRAPSAVKADIFTRRVMFPQNDMQEVTSAKDAMIASMNYRGTVDLSYMAAIYNKDEAEIERELGDLVFRTPDGDLVTADDYLSGDVKTKLTDAQAAVGDNPDMKRNVEALKAVIPKDKTPSEIHVAMNSPFLPGSILSAFVEEVTGYTSVAAAHVKAVGQWVLHTGGAGDPVRLTQTWGTARMSADDIIKATLMGRAVVVTDTHRNPDGSTTTTLNEKETEAAREKQTALRNEFKSWLWRDGARGEEVLGAYNEKMNRTVQRAYDGAHLSLPGKNPGINLLAHQLNGVWRGLQSRQILLDHVVGAGKTFQMVAMAMEMRRLGIARKPVFIVPNHLTLQWKSEFSRLYPGSNVLAATPDDFAKDMRPKLFSKIVTGDWDAVILGHSSLKRIGLPPEIEGEIIKEQIDELSASIEEMKRGRGDRNIVRDMEGIKARLEARAKERLAAVGARDKVLTFDELGLDALFVDELHEFKNLQYTSTMTRVPGMGNPAGSARGFDLFLKTQWLFRTFGDKAPLVTATGTPVSNSLVEMFNVQRYMQYPSMKEAGTHIFDAWAAAYGSVESLYEVAPSGSGFRASSRFAKFQNLGSLMGQYMAFADVVTLDDLKSQEEALGKRFPVPKIRGGRPTTVIAQRSQSVADFMGVPQLDLKDDRPQFTFEPDSGDTAEIVEKEGKYIAVVVKTLGGTIHLGTHAKREDAEIAIAQAALTPQIKLDPKSILGKFADLRRLTKESKGKVNALSLTGEANKAGLDYRLINPSAPDFPGSKVNLAADNIIKVHAEWKADRGTQLVFLDMSVPLSARAAVASKPKRAYVRNPDGTLTHKRATLHAVDGAEFLPYLVAEGKAKSFDVYDATTGHPMYTGAASRAAARQWAETAQANDDAREAWIAKRSRSAELDQEQIDAYNDENEIDVAEVESLSLEDIIGISGSAKFSVYDDLRAKLIAKGIPESEIAFIHDYDTPAAKSKLFAAVNRGDIRVLMGSTPKMGAGTNVQQRAVALHHIDAPWRPSDLEQREGRIIRRGNHLYDRDPEGFEVQIFRYATEQTYDARRWQILEHKARGIEQLRNYDGTLNEIEDIDGEAANAADMKAAASGDPLILRETQLRNEVKRLETLEVAHADNAVQARRAAQAATTFATAQGPRRLKEVRAVLADVKPAAATGKVPAGSSVAGKKADDRDGFQAKIAAAVGGMAKDVTEGRPTAAFEIAWRGIVFEVSVHPFIKSAITIDAPTGQLMNFQAGSEFSALGLITRMNNYIDRLPSEVQAIEADIVQKQSDATRFIEASNKPFELANELVTTREEYRRVQRTLMLKGPNLPKQQKAILETGLASQRDAVRKAGFGAALDKLMGSDTPGAFSKASGRTTGTPVEAVRRAVSAITTNWKGDAPRVQVLATAEDLPASAKTDPDYKLAEGYYDPATGTVYLVAPNLRSTARALEVLAHEAIGHYGMEAITGPQVWAQITDTVGKMRQNPKHADLFAEIGRRYGARPSTDPVFVREAVAVMSEKGVRNSVIDRAVAALRAFLRRLGFSISFSEAELRQQIVRAARSVSEATKLTGADALSRLAALGMYEKELADPDVREFVSRSFQAKADEKQSDPSDWTDAERSAYDAGNWEKFSRLRGYSEKEIDNFRRFMALAKKLDARYGEDFAVGLDYDSVESLRSGQSTNGQATSRQPMVDSSPGNDRGILGSSPARSAPDMTESEGLVAAFKALATVDETFRYPVSQATDIETVFAQVAPRFTIERKGTASVEFEKDSGVDHDATKYQIQVKDDPDTSAYVYVEQGGNRFYLDAAEFKAGESGGSAMYAALFNYAYNSGKVFIGDPNGLSDEALIRRTELMASAALKFGTTRMMEPHPRQRFPDVRWAHAVAWKRPTTPGRDMENIAALLRSSYNNVARFAPEIRNVRYAFERRELLDAGGKPVSLGELGRIAQDAARAFARRPGAERSDGQSDAAVVGRATVARAIAFQSALREAGRRGWPALVAQLAERSPARTPSDPLNRAFYSKPDPAAGGVSVSGDRESTLTQEFKAWFGDSKVVDADGKPLVVYHGTRADFDAFSQSDAKTPWLFGEDNSNGFFFTVNPGRRSDSGPWSGAAGFAGTVQRDGETWAPIGANVLPVYLSLQNPYKIAANEYRQKGSRKDFREEIESLGYDGIAVSDGTFVAFHPEQIKSVHNRGTFDPNDSRILFSKPDPEAGKPTTFSGAESTLVDRISEALRNPGRSLVEFIKNAVENWRPQWLGALSLRHLAELGQGSLPFVGQYADLVQQIATDRNVMQEEGAEVAEKWQKWAAKNRAQNMALVDLMHDATIAGTDPAEAYQDIQINYAGKKLDATRKNVADTLKAMREQIRGRGRDDKTEMFAKMKMVKGLIGRNKYRRKAHADLSGRWQALSPEAQAMYREVRDLYAKRRNEREAALIARIRDQKLDGHQERAIIDHIRQQFESARVESPYFPLQRFGDFWIAATSPDGEKTYVMRETHQQWRDEQAAMKSAGFTIDAVGRKGEKSKSLEGASAGFVTDVIERLKKSGAPITVQDEIYQMYLQSLPDLSQRKHSIHRKKIAGYSADAIRSFGTNMLHEGHQIARMRYSHQLEGLVGLMGQSIDARRKGDADPTEVAKADALLTEMKRRHEWIMNPTDSKLTNAVSSLGFVYYLGLTPAAALVNLTQTAMTTFPALAANPKIGHAKAMNLLLAAMRDSIRTGGHIQRTLTDATEQRAYQALRSSGAIDKTQAHNLAGIAEGDSAKFSPAWAKGMNAISFLFHRAEVINREATGMAAFRAATEAGMTFDDAVRFAGDTIQTTHFDYSNANRARWMQGNVAKVLLMFRQYSLNMTWFLARNAWQSMKGQTPEVRRQALRTLTGTLGMTAIFSGALGLPVLGMVFGLLNAAAASFGGGDDEPWDAETEFRNFLADLFGVEAGAILADGPVNALTGADIAGRVSLNGLWFRDADRELEGRDAYFHLLEQAAGPVGGIVKNALVGKQLIDQGQVWRGVETILPKSVKDYMKGARYATEGVNNLRGDAIVEDLTPWQSLLQLSGFTPAEVSRQYDANRAIKGYEKHILDRRQRLIDAFAMSVRLGDTDGRAEVLQKIAKFNRVNPEIPITMATIERSLRGRARYSAKAEGGIVVNRRIEQRAREAARFAGGDETR